ncbi:MFS transporter [Spirochaeta thermophila]|uniref:MFS transporter n=1 Tax=Winmispira thermophila TaxID=154 RepID=UPI0002D2BEC2|nr:MFS transporter [Spirochaeta thermophila]
MKHQIRSSLGGPLFLSAMAVQFLISTSTFMLFTALPLYFQTQGSPKTVAGLSTTLFAIAALLARPLGGVLFDRYDRTLVFHLGVGTLIGATSLMALPAGIPYLLTCRLLQGVGFSLFTTGMGVLLPDFVPQGRVLQAIAIQGLVASLGPALGGPLAVQLLPAGFELVVVTSTLIGIAGMGLAVPTFPRAPSSRDGEGSASSQDLPHRLWSRLFHKEALAPSAFALLLGLSYGAALTFIPGYALTRGIPNGGLFFTSFTLAVVLTRLFFGKVQGDLSLLMSGSFIVSGISFLLLIPLSGYLHLLVSGLLYGAGYGVAFPILNTGALMSAAHHRRGAAASTFFTAMDAGVAVGSLLAGGIAQALGFPAVFLTLGIGLLLGGGVILLPEVRRAGFLHTRE